MNQYTHTNSKEHCDNTKYISKTTKKGAEGKGVQDATGKKKNAIQWKTKETTAIIEASKQK